MVESSVQAGSKSQNEADKQIKFLSNLGKIKTDQWVKEMRKSGETDLNMLVNYFGEQQKIRADVILGGIERLKGNKSLLGQKANPTTKEGAGAIAAEADKVKSQKYTNITINIDKVTGIEKVENKTENQLGEITGDAITRYLIKGITDAQIAAE
jgi:hypothetical protein